MKNRVFNPDAARVAAECDAFNRAHPVGTPVHYWKWAREGEPSGQGPTRSMAQEMCGTAVIWIEGCVGCVALSHVEVIS